MKQGNDGTVEWWNNARAQDRQAQMFAPGFTNTPVPRHCMASVLQDSITPMLRLFVLHHSDVLGIVNDTPFSL